MSLSEAELERYARHLILREIGGAGQAALKSARVMVIGAGGIGSPVIQYLAAAGIGTLVIADDDRVDLSNLQRQTIFATADLGQPKALAARDRALALNPEIAVEAVEGRIDPVTVDRVAGMDVVIDGTDNFATRLIVADACLRHRVPLVSAAVGQFDGQLAVFRGWEADRPCYRCWVGSDPDRPDISCADQGVLGAMTGVMGSLAGIEAVRQIVSFGADPAGKLLIADALDFRFRTLTLPKDPGCPACGAA
jgi:adenylyltransferase/sulfurtransferase